MGFVFVGFRGLSGGVVFRSYGGGGEGCSAILECGCEGGAGGVVVVHVV